MLLVNGAQCSKVTTNGIQPERSCVHIFDKIDCRRALRIRVQLFSNTRDASAGDKRSVAKDGDLDGEVSVPLTDVTSPPYYRAIRAILDCGYHSNYSLTRQNL